MRVVAFHVLSSGEYQARKWYDVECDYITHLGENITPVFVYLDTNAGTFTIWHEYENFCVIVEPLSAEATVRCQIAIARARQLDVPLLTVRLPRLGSEPERGCIPRVSSGAETLARLTLVNSKLGELRKNVLLAYDAKLLGVLKKSIFGD